MKEENIPIATIDLNRQVRTGQPEVVYCEGKTTEQCISIIKEMCAAGCNVLGTRLSEDKAEVMMRQFPNAVYDACGRTFTLCQKSVPSKKGSVAIVTGGTSDMPVAEEAAVTLAFFGNQVRRIYDVGVAGLHRLLSHQEELEEASVILAVAGMEGALPSVVAGLTKKPVIAVPTSVGYGTAQKGMTALHAMLTSCASGLSVVNIDNGFGAACMADKITALLEK